MICNKHKWCGMIFATFVLFTISVYVVSCKCISLSCVNLCNECDDVICTIYDVTNYSIVWSELWRHSKSHLFRIRFLSSAFFYIPKLGNVLLLPPSKRSTHFASYSINNTLNQCIYFSLCLENILLGAILSPYGIPTTWSIHHTMGSVFACLFFILFIILVRLFV